MIPITPLEWDTDFFGYKVGKALLESDTGKVFDLGAFINYARASSYRLVYLFASEDYILPEKWDQLPDILLADRKVTYEKFLFANEDVDTSGVIAYNKPLPTAELVELGLQSGEYSRYKVDGHFKQGEFERLYQKWIDNSVNRIIASDLLVIEHEDGAEIGMITLSVRNRVGSIGLLSVNNNYRRRFLGKRLIVAAEQLCLDRGVHTMHVVTQKDNSIACSFYERNGYRVLTSEKIYHLWI